MRVFAFAAAIALAAPQSPIASQALPSRLSDSAFWSMVTEFSESDGYFRSDNLVSNETTLQWVIPELIRSTKPGGVYLGVGPDQNFTYIVALKPKLAFVVDIRRQNLLMHLMYKAIIEQSSDRADFISRLFSRPRPPGLDSNSTPETIFAAFAGVAFDSVRCRRNLAGIRDVLVRRHGFGLSDVDLDVMSKVYESFASVGPEITYNTSPGRTTYGFSQMPSYAVLQTETDSARVHRGYLATEANFRTLKDAELRNAIVPLVGDFAGSKALRSVSAFLKAHRASVTAFYLSNVEQYLFQDPDNWRKFYSNAATLPIDSSSLFIRSVFNGMTYNRDQSLGPYMRSQQMLAPIMDQLRAFSDGRLLQYLDVIQTSR